MRRFPTMRVLALALFTGALLLAFQGCNGSKNPTSPGGGGGGGTTADHVITIVAENGANSFSPSPDTVTVGQTVAWKNSAGTTHTATSDSPGFNTGNIANGATSAAITMGTAGSFPYHCSIHPTMTGILVVKP